MFNSQKLIVLCLLSLMTQLGFAQPSSDEMKRNVEEVTVRNTTSANTSNLDFSPSYYQNGIVFASSRFKSGKKDKNINETFFELFYAETDGSGDLLKPRPFSLAVNSFLHEGPVTFNRAGDKIFFTRNNIKKGFRKADKGGVTRLKIYEAQKGAYDWTSVVELPFNSDEFSCAHPTLSADETKLYFASDRPGGHGGMDIWMVTKNGDAWGTPTNLGPEINTAKNEAFPFIHSSGNLIFTSNGHNTKGGLDLFLVDVSGEGSSKSVYNLGEPFNTTADDLGLILSPDGRSGYFTSARSGGKGKDDIYFYEAPNGILGETTADVFSSTITIYDLMDKSLIEGAAIRIFEKRNDGFLSGGNDLYEAVLMPSDDNSGELVFKLIRKDQGSLSAPDRMSDAQGEAVYDFMGEKEYMILVTKDGYASKEMTYSTLGNISNSNIRVPLDKTRCTPLTGVVRNKLTNKILPGAIVKLWNGCSGTEEEVLADKNGSYEYCLKPGCDYMVKGVKTTYSGDFVKIGSDELSAPNLKKDVYLTPAGSPSPTVAVGTVIVLENIYYDFNKSDIRTGATRELDELLIMMQQYPSMNIELISHTDSRGDSNYNLGLSQRRAESAKQHLIARGIASSRIRAVGNGESQPRNQCTDGVKCSEDEHQYNRRTEVKVTSINNGVNIRYNNNAPEVIDRRND